MTLGSGKAVTPRFRNRFQVLTAGVTGLVAFGALAATGWVSGVAAKAYADDQAEKDAAADQADVGTGTAAGAPVVVEKRRPHRTVVKTTVIQRVSTGAATVPGSGGTVTSRPSNTGSTPQVSQSSGGSGSAGSGSSGGQTSSQSPPKPPPPAPPPPKPAPSSGS